MTERKIQLAKPMVGQEELDEIKKVFDTGYLTEGPATFQFEQQFANYVGARHAHAMPNCSIALEAALRAYDIGPGDEVITSDFTYPISAEVAWFTGAEPVLVDIDLDSYNMNMQQASEMMNDDVKAVIPVSEFGNPLDLAPLRELQEDYDFKIIEDAACSTGASINGKKTGSTADTTAFSFHPRKILTTGEGGMLTMNDDILSMEVDALKNFGFRRSTRGSIRPGVFATMGTNYKMPNVLGAMGLAQMQKLDKMILDRVDRAAAYSLLLREHEDMFRTPVVKQGYKHVFQSYIIYFNKPGIRDSVMLEMKKRGIETQLGTFCLHLEPAFKNVKRSSSLKNSELAYLNTLALPLHSMLTQNDIEYVVQNLIEVTKAMK